MEMRSDSRELDKIYKRRDRYEIPDQQVVDKSEKLADIATDSDLVG